MNILSKKRKSTVKQDSCPSERFDKAKAIAKQYEQLGKCCEILASCEPKEDDSYVGMFSAGWRVWRHTVADAGIDVKEVYEHIARLAAKRKAEIECELAKLNV